MITFTVAGEFDIPMRKYPGGRVIDTDKLEEWWDADDIGSRRGVYVFGMRAGRGIIPWYVGMATKSFRQETFAPDKLAKYCQVLPRKKTAVPVMFFLLAPKGQGAPPVKVIRKLENDLINDLWWWRNAELINKQGKAPPQWAIQGVVRGGQGKPSHGAQAFAKMYGMGAE